MQQSLLRQEDRQQEKSDDILVAKNGILIVGAGLAGLSLALALSRVGIESAVIEKQIGIAPSKWAVLVYPREVDV